MESCVFRLVIWLSRIAGMAPYPWRSDGHHQLTKIYLTLYGFVLVTSNSVGMMINVLKAITADHMKLRAINIMHLFCNVSSVVLILLGGFSAPRRIARITQITKQLEQIEEKCSSQLTIPTDIRTSYFILNISFILYVIGYLALRVMFGLNLHSLGESIGDVVLHWLNHYIAISLEMQLAVFAGRIVMTHQLMNESVQKLLSHSFLQQTDTITGTSLKRKVAWEEAVGKVTEENNKNYSDDISTDHFNAESIQTNVDEERPQYKIRYYATTYIKLADIIQELTAAHGLEMVIILIYHMFNFERFSINLFEELNTSGMDYGAVLKLLNAIAHVLGLILFIEPFHRTYQQVERTRLLVQFLKVPYSDSEPVTNELELFMRLLVLQRISYSPLDLVTMNRSLLLKILSSLMTFLVISLTYGSSIK